MTEANKPAKIVEYSNQVESSPKGIDINIDQGNAYNINMLPGATNPPNRTSSPNVITGTSTPTILPRKNGDIFIDTVNVKAYIAINNTRQSFV